MRKRIKNGTYLVVRKIMILLRNIFNLQDFKKLLLKFVTFVQREDEAIKKKIIRY